MNKFYRNNEPEVVNVTTTAAATSIAVVATVKWYKDSSATLGVCYKKKSQTAWTYVSAAGGAVDTTLSSLTANTNYEIAFYALYDSVYHYCGNRIVKTLSE